MCMCVSRGGGLYQSPQAVFHSRTALTHCSKLFLGVNEINKDTCSVAEDIQELVADLKKYKLVPKLTQVDQ